MPTLLATPTCLGVVRRTETEAYGEGGFRVDMQSGRMLTQRHGVSMPPSRSFGLLPPSTVDFQRSRANWP